MNIAPDLADFPRDNAFIIAGFLNGVAIVCFCFNQRRRYQASTQDSLLRDAIVSVYSTVITKTTFSFGR